MDVPFTDNDITLLWFSRSLDQVYKSARFGSKCVYSLRCELGLLEVKLLMLYHLVIGVT